jgi:hypothetical protein
VNDKHGDARTVMYGALPSGPSVMAREVPALSATTAATSTNATRSCLPGPNTYSTTSGHATRFRYTVHSGSTLFGHDPVLSVSYAVGSSFTFFSRTVGTFYRRHTESCTVLVALVSDGVFYWWAFCIWDVGDVEQHDVCGWALFPPTPMRRR